MRGSILEGQAGRRVTLNLARDANAPSSARRALEQLDHRLDGQREYVAKLLLSELVSNAVKYGADGPVRLELESSHGGVRVEVIDPGPGFMPARRERDLDDPGGWGLVLVELLSSRWGSSARSSHLWFEIDA